MPSALRFLYRITLKRQDAVEQIPFPKQEKRLPSVLSPEEVQRLFEAVENRKHRLVDPQCLGCNEQTVSAEQMIQWFLLRWQVEVTFAEMRAHLGMETQRPWSEKAIDRTTPALFGLFSVVTLSAHELLAGGAVPARRAAWYAKQEATFSDLLALVRQQLWPVVITRTSTAEDDVVLIPRPLLLRMTETLAFAA